MKLKAIGKFTIRLDTAKESVSEQVDTYEESSLEYSQRDGKRDGKYQVKRQREQNEKSEICLMEVLEGENGEKVETVF